MPKGRKSKKTGKAKSKKTPKRKTSQPKSKPAKKDSKKTTSKKITKKVTPKNEAIKPEVDLSIGILTPRPIVEEMQESYLDYAMSVIVSRALPDVRDGLKPVQRRILYAMWTLGLKASAKFRKSATVVGEVLGKYHPHGDQSVYEAMVRMAQDFSLRTPLINGQGNFGSMDGDGAAAMRYTESKMAKVAEELLYDIDKDTVDFVPNYDASQKEPKVFPAKLPNALLNGSMGIAVGMATNIPPHNMGEIITATAHLIDHPKAGVDDLMQFVKGPDFPTGGIIFNRQDIQQAYATGRGSIVMRGRAEIVEQKKGNFHIIITEVPFQVNKATMIEKIADLVKTKRLEGIKDLRDESDKDGVRVVVELKKEAFPNKVLNRLYTLTALQEKFHVNMLALVDGIQPQVLNLKMMLEYYIKHRQEVVRRRTQFELDRARDRAHILEGFKKALDIIDRVIKVIKKSKNKEAAGVALMKTFKFTEKQAAAILEMRLHQLAALERQKILDELKEKKKLIKELEAILASPKKILEVIKNELKELREKYDSERRTKVFSRAVDNFSQEDLIPNEEVVVTITRGGYIKSLPSSTYKAQGRGGKGIIGMATKEEDMVDHFFASTTHSDILFFTSNGRVFQLKAYEIPKSTRQAKGHSIVNFLQLGPEESVTAAIALDNFKNVKFLAMVTKKGVIKKVAIDQFAKVRRSGLIAIKIKKGDELKWVKPTAGNDQIMLFTHEGQAIRMKEEAIRAMGRNASGVRGMRLKGKDFIVGMDIITTKEHDNNVMVITEKGYGKKTSIAQYKVQGRGGSGIKTAKVTAKNGNIKAAEVVDDSVEEIIIISKKGQVIRIKAETVPTLGRATQGVRVMRLDSGDAVASVAYI
ncbi:MAG: DNA gyrase subunit A [bacterium]